MLFFWCILFVWCISGGVAQQAVQLPGNVSIPAVIAFGDSIVDQGLNNRRNTVAKCNFPPYGKDFMGGVSTGRFSNGRTPPDLIASKLGIKELVPAYLDPNLRNEDLPTGVSFASGGMGYDPQTNKLLTALPFPDQLKLFKEYIDKLKVLVGEEGTNYTLANAVFLVIAGSNDFANTYFTVGLRRVKYDVPSYADLLLAYASEYVQAIYELGARRIAVFGVPPIGCLPSQRSLAGGVHRNCVQSYNEAAQTYNTKLISKLNSLGQTLPQSKIIYADIYNPVLDIIQSPQNYGIDVVNKGCCGTGNIEASILCNKLSKTCPDRSAYLFWDSFHPTQKGYEIIVNQFLKNEFDQLL